MSYERAVECLQMKLEVNTHLSIIFLFIYGIINATIININQHISNNILIANFLFELKNIHDIPKILKRTLQDFNSTLPLTIARMWCTQKVCFS